MTAPCNLSSADGSHATCRCPVVDSPYQDMPGPEQCTHTISSIPADFDMHLMPGAEYVIDADCAKLPGASAPGSGYVGA